MFRNCDVYRNQFAVAAAALLLGMPIGAAYAGSFKVLHTFQPGNSDGGMPQAGLTLDKSGNLYSSTVEGGSMSADVMTLAGVTGV